MKESVTIGEWVLRGGAGNRESGIGNRESGIGNRESAIGNRQSAIGNRKSRPRGGIVGKTRGVERT
ncbi:hypothetical protein XcuCFBP2542_17390 [Xanthomonas cucurbitae]|uniref:Uncharacterized protein n=1 Tax=Xanthomonas cucurbitae TaxID=56453 RepID=A0A2S7DF05_9XANT|nr:hypothetical protein XcuCFBP2542_17390 [Xanthomonas cucurbitae]